jgi:hypothetical protein
MGFALLHWLFVLAFFAIPIVVMVLIFKAGKRRR